MKCWKCLKMVCFGLCRTYAICQHCKILFFFLTEHTQTDTKKIRETTKNKNANQHTLWVCGNKQWLFFGLCSAFKSIQFGYLTSLLNHVVRRSMARQSTRNDNSISNNTSSRNIINNNTNKINKNDLHALRSARKLRFTTRLNIYNRRHVMDEEKCNESLKWMSRQFGPALYIIRKIAWK